MTCPEREIIIIPCQWTKVFNVQHMRQLEQHLNTDVDGYLIKKREYSDNSRRRHPYFWYFIDFKGECIGGFKLDQQTMFRWTFSIFWTDKQIGEEDFHKALLEALNAYGVKYEP